MRTYKYGAMRPIVNAELAQDQLYKAHRYKNKLVEIARLRRGLREAIMDPDPGVATANMQVASAREALVALPENAPEKVVKTAKASLGRAYRALYAARKVVLDANNARIEQDSEVAALLLRLKRTRSARTKKETKKALAVARRRVKTTAPDWTLDSIDLAAEEAVRVARGESGVYWGTYLCVEDAIERAISTGREPHFHRYDGGTLAVQIQKSKPLSVEGLLAGEDTRCQLHHDKNRMVHLHLRIGSADDKSPIWAVFPVILHRPLPPEADIKWVKVTARRVGTKLVYAAIFIVDGDNASLPSPRLGSIGIDVGWRRHRGPAAGDGLRVATWVDDTGNRGELRLPERLLLRGRKVHDLESIRDKNFNMAMGFFREWKAAAQLPVWFQAEAQHAHLWKEQGRLARLVIAWRTARLAGDEVAFTRLEGWRKQDKHLLEWAANQRESVLRCRREHYRIFAKWLAQYRQIAVEDLDLRDFAEHPEEGEPKERPVTVAARPYRFQAAISELLYCMKDAAGRSGSCFTKVEPAGTTKTCAQCGGATVFDAALQLTHRCEHCGEEWDQDFNAAVNILRAATSGASTPARSKVKSSRAA